MTASLLLAGVVLACGLGIVLIAVRERRRHEALTTLLAGDVPAEVPGDVPDRRRLELAAPVASRLLRPLILRASEAVRRSLPAGRLAATRTALVQAGLAGRVTAEEFVTLRLVAAGAGLILAALVWDGTARSLALALLVLFVGVVAPRALLDNRRAARVAQVERELPDVIDLLAICVSAGQGLEAAMSTVSERRAGVLPAELRHTLREMELGVDRRAALEHLRERLGVPDVSGLVAALVQADVLGTPVSDVLRTQAVEQRRRRRGQVREQAAKLPVKMLLPLTVFILPALFVVILGPAALSIRQVFG